MSKRGRPATKNKEEQSNLKPKIKVVGIGGAGGNALNFMIGESIKDVDFVAMNTDYQDLEKSKAKSKVQIGSKITRGLGAGSEPEVGKLGAEEDREQIKAAISGTDLLFITCGMGGGTGTGAAPVIASIAREMGILTVAVVSRPFTFEGMKRGANSVAGISELANSVDTIVVVPNDKLFELPSKNITLMNAFEAANNILRIGITGISDLLLNQGYINLDFADIRTIISNSGIAMLGFGYAEGEDRAKAAAEEALNSPLLEKPIRGASKILLNITSGMNLGLNEVNEIASMVAKAAGDEATEVIFGTVIDQSMDKGLRVTVIATNFVERPENRISQKIAQASTEDNNRYSEALDIPAFLRRNRS